MKDKKINEYMYHSTFAHEFCHILGFSGSLYGMFVDANRKTVGESNLLKVGEFMAYWVCLYNLTGRLGLLAEHSQIGIVSICLQNL